LYEFTNKIKDFFNEIGRMVTDKVEIINKVIKECNINFDIKIDNGDVVDYLKNQKKELGDYIYNNLNNLK
jgi:hypothetical protein